jgi:hypothetical protein
VDVPSHGKPANAEPADSATRTAAVQATSTILDIIIPPALSYSVRIRSLPGLSDLWSDVPSTGLAHVKPGQIE